MTLDPHFHGVHEDRLIWQTIDEAIELPKVYQRTDNTLILRFGQRTLGWEMLGQRVERAGPALDISGATVRLYARDMPQRRSHVERKRFMHRRHRGALGGFFNLFNITGAVTDGPGGEATFALSAAALDAAGRFLLEPIVELGGTRLVPRHLKLTILAGLEP